MLAAQVLTAQAGAVHLALKDSQVQPDVAGRCHGPLSAVSKPLVEGIVIEKCIGGRFAFGPATCMGRPVTDVSTAIFCPKLGSAANRSRPNHGTSSARLLLFGTDQLIGSYATLV